MAGIPQLTIEQQLAEIGVSRTPAQMHIEQQRMNMRIKTETPQMEIERKNPSFKVNRKKINSESGLKPAPEFTKEVRDKGKAGALRGAKIAVEDGNFLGDVRKPGDRVGRLARNKTMSAILRRKEMNIGLMPKSQPEVVWDRGYMRINWSKHSIVIDWDGEYMPKVTIDPKYSIEIYLRTEPFLQVSVSEGDDHGVTGRLVDKAI